MKIKLKDLEYGVAGIYKITFPNGKIYVGMSNDIKRRMFEHNSPSEDKTVCDKAINKYGRIAEIEILEKVSSLEDIEEKEIEWIKKLKATDRDVGYNISNGGLGTGYGENNHRSAFTNEEVLEIRKRRFNGERKRDVYEDFSHQLFPTFENVWLGRGYSDIGKEYQIKPHSKTRAEYSSIANSGERNNGAKLNEDDVREIRRLYDSGVDEKEIFKKYPFVTPKTVRRVFRRETWKSVK